MRYFSRISNEMHDLNHHRTTIRASNRANHDLPTSSRDHLVQRNVHKDNHLVSSIQYPQEPLQKTTQRLTKSYSLNLKKTSRATQNQLTSNKRNLFLKQSTARSKPLNSSQVNSRHYTYLCTRQCLLYRVKPR